MEIEKRVGEGYVNQIRVPQTNYENIILAQEKVIEKKINRRFRSDKLHNIKFPVDGVMCIKLKNLNKRVNERLKQDSKKEITQTEFNTRLLRFGLKNENIINWKFRYKDTKKYMHTNIRELEYDRIGGKFGYAVTQMCSDRKAVTIIIQSVIKFIDAGGDIFEIVQQR